VPSAAAFLLAFGAIGRAQAQTAVPLDFFGGNRLGITIGVDGGAAREYLFDTGSDLFNIGIGAGASPPWFPTYSGPKNPDALTAYLYGNGTYGYLYSPATISSITFYTPGGNNIGGASYNAALPAGAVVYDIGTEASLKERDLQQGSVISNSALANGTTTPLSKGQVYYVNRTWQNAIASGTAPEEGRLYGTFGAGDYGASILGRIASGGYVVEANGRDTTPGGCGQACLIVGLTPELRAQFFSIVPWTKQTAVFPNSNLPASEEFGAAFNYVVGSGGAMFATLLDTGYAGNELNSPALLKQLQASGETTGNYANGGLSLSNVRRCARGANRTGDNGRQPEFGELGSSDWDCNGAGRSDRRHIFLYRDRGHV
jgi:subtilase-type serine protease